MGWRVEAGRERVGGSREGEGWEEDGGGGSLALPRGSRPTTLTKQKKIYQGPSGDARERSREEARVGTKSSTSFLGKRRSKRRFLGKHSACLWATNCNDYRHNGFCKCFKAGLAICLLVGRMDRTKTVSRTNLSTECLSGQPFNL